MIKSIMIFLLIYLMSQALMRKKVVMKQLGYHDDEVAVTGLPRFDHLPQKILMKLKDINNAYLETG